MITKYEDFINENLSDDERKKLALSMMLKMMVKDKKTFEENYLNKYAELVNSIRGINKIGHFLKIYKASSSLKNMPKSIEWFYGLCSKLKLVKDNLGDCLFYLDGKCIMKQTYHEYMDKLYINKEIVYDYMNNNFQPISPRDIERIIKEIMEDYFNIKIYSIKFVTSQDEWFKLLPNKR